MTTTTYTFADVDQAATAYQAADPSTKGKMRTAVADAILAAVRSGDLGRAQELATIQEALKAAKPAKPEVDFRQVVADRIATLTSAIEACLAGDVNLPEGVEVDLTDLPDGSIVGDDLTSFVTFTGRKAIRGSVADYVAEALERLDGPATIAQLRGAWVASTDYPTEAPTSGAIGACLKRDSDDRFDAVEVAGVAGAELA